MRRYWLPEGLWLSFFSIRFYQDVAARWRARSLAYLVLLLALCWIPGFIQMHTIYHTAMARLRLQLDNRFPTVSIMNGEVHTPEAKPYALSLERSKQPWLLIDTTGQTQSISETSATILVTKHQISIRRSPTEIRLYDLSHVNNIVIDNALLQRILQKLDDWVPIVIYPTVFVMSLIKRFFEALVLALLGLVIVSWMEATLDFPALLSLAVVALTPEMLLWTWLEQQGHVFFGRAFLLLGVALAYFLFGVNAATDAPEETPHE